MTEPPELPKAAPEPPKPALPQALPPAAVKPEPAKSDAAPSDPAKADLPKAAAPKAGPPEGEQPKPAAARAEPPRPVPPKPASPAPARPAQPSRSALPVFCAAGFLLLAGAVLFLWQELRIVADQSDPARIALLDGQIRSLQQRLTQLEQRPVPPPPPQADLAPLAARLAALEQRPAAPSDTSGAIDAQLAALQARVAQAEARATQVTDTATRAARLQAAGVALAFGQPLGDIPGAPAALARFAAANPPTEAGLRQSFGAASRRAEAASRPDTAGLSFGARVWQRVTSLVTVRQGPSVLVGPPAAVALGEAQDHLESGDLAGAVTALDALDTPAALAMAPWRAQAQSLLDARAALAALARF